MLEVPEGIRTRNLDLSLAAHVPQGDTLLDMPVITHQVLINQGQVHIIVGGICPAPVALCGLEIRGFADAEADQSGFLAFRFFRHDFLN
jgi:hypothetical protein